MSRNVSLHLVTVLDRAATSPAAARAARERARTVRAEALVRRVRREPLRVDPATEAVLRAHLCRRPPHS
ncbi:hypothetical protein [Actinomycetospora cinnamomea]|uniref:Uncharacterized protein n=1 Tax=Actinomycetospora cinnamomea TaxID=663609 RepID=A0A2U1F832_9PSEU|nr:hypothetical protein [Actinomycetospora cinnamomea]PVZ08140.1 hypothetical protein C8D89_10923 [Actinomycetospora cinnamomea]